MSHDVRFDRYVLSLSLALAAKGFAVRRCDGGENLDAARAAADATALGWEVTTNVGYLQSWLPPVLVTANLGCHQS